MKNDMESAAEIVERAWKQKARMEARRVKMLKLYQAGVDGVGDPDRPCGVFQSSFDSVFDSMFGIIRPRGRIQMADRDDELAEAKAMAAHIHEDDGTDVCGYCGHSKRRGEWCDNRRCSSQAKRGRRP